MQDTKFEIIRLADKLIRTKGYNGFSYKDISTELQIKNAAVHYHFPSKADLGAMVIKTEREQFINVMDAHKNTLSSLKVLDAFFNLYINWQKEGNICLIAALSPAYNYLPEAMQKEFKDYFEEIKTWLNNTLEKGADAKEFSFIGTVEEKTDYILASLTASLPLSIINKRDITHTIIDQIKAELAKFA